MAKAKRTATRKHTRRVPRLSEQIRAATKKYAQSRGHTMQDVVKGSGLAAEQLSRFVTGKRGLTWKSTDQLAEFLELQIVTLN